MTRAEQFMQSRLEQRTLAGSLRRLEQPGALIDFSSNDYLGFARSGALRERAEGILNSLGNYKHGATGSRLLSGNHAFTEETEAYIAAFHGAESGLIFNSGYDANVGLLSSLPQRGDTIISDELVHASIKDGARLSHANRFTFKHNDVDQLESRLRKASGNIYVVVESVYSMDGDLAPLLTISTLCERYGAALIVDEAHATGLFGDHGRGLVSQLKLESKVFARIMTFGKALGSHGAAVIGSNTLRNYLINFARSFIYTTAAPVHGIAMVRAGYHLLNDTNYTEAIANTIKLYTARMQAEMPHIITTESTIQTLICPSNDSCRNAAAELQSQGFDVRAILSPTVPVGYERLRICLHLYNTDSEIIGLVNALSKLNV
ncbi:aminotransferase class I/II-fold pyridoxal phosphate-dependent enzyme [Pedobacter deserti]|uniref:aminotransferase class I/II-fold pyridoxal phosphate-dependent enzyme n=1 Tax=Pedobacter deserti TaxID=2817382 RepID=UPI00210C6391|nr:8-amino-7-oxononanoate synthase [Pedobacter sp. SYSU D00382]